MTSRGTEPVFVFATLRLRVISSGGVAHDGTRIGGRDTARRGRRVPLRLPRARSGEVVPAENADLQADLEFDRAFLRTAKLFATIDVHPLFSRTCFCFFLQRYDDANQTAGDQYGNRHSIPLVLSPVPAAVFCVRLPNKSRMSGILGLAHGTRCLTAV